MNTVAERMAELGLVGKKRRRRRSLTRPDPHAPKFANLIRRDFNPPAPNVTWCGDITEIRTWEGKLYLATVIDRYSRRLIGFAIAEHCKAALVCAALNSRPRKTLGWRTPAEALDEHLRSLQQAGVATID